MFLLAQQVRRSHWATNKALMERTIPVFEALIEADRTKHYYFAQLAFAQKDQLNADWSGAKANIDRAFELLDSREMTYWPYYQLCRAACHIELDDNFRQGKASDKGSRKAILGDLEVVRSSTPDYLDMLNQPWNLNLRRWLSLNEPATRQDRERT